MLLALTVAIHAAVLSALLRRLNRGYRDNVSLNFSGYLWLLMRLAAVIVLAHLFEIALWAGYYSWKQALPSLEASYYFSAVTYATIGYGDIVLPETWRMLAAMEGLTGILMCGWSGAFFFAVVSKVNTRTRSSE
jgi:voltage-gated potassium channel Kch